VEEGTIGANPVFTAIVKSGGKSILGRVRHLEIPPQTDFFSILQVISWPHG
jgi:hypothetical protein